MGHNPIPPPPRPTRLTVAERAYLAGRISVEQFETWVEEMLRDGNADEVAPILPPPKPSDSARSVMAP